MNSGHIFSYAITESNVENVPPQAVSMVVQGEPVLKDMFEFFLRYLRAVGYVIPEHAELALVNPAPENCCTENKCRVENNASPYQEC